MSVVKGLIKKYDSFVLDIPVWEIQDRGITVLWGPSGAGKSTVFRLLLGLEPCPGLSWIFKGEDLASLSVPERRVGVVFQTLELFPHVSAAENILFAAEARQIPKSDAEERLSALAKELQIESCLERQSVFLSGGEAQRVALARAIMGQPRLLFLDEPFSSLDVTLKAEAREVVRNTIKRSAIPTLLVSHDPEDLKVMADASVKIEKGKLLF